MSIKNYNILFLIFFLKFNFCFYEDIKIEYEYEFYCEKEKENCKLVHESINEIYKKLSKIWFGLDFFKTVQFSIPQDDINYIQIISEIIKLIDFVKIQKLKINENIFLFHHNEKILIENIINYIMDHAALKTHEILFKCLEILKENLF